MPDNDLVSHRARPVSAVLSMVVLGAVVLFLGSLAFLTAYGYVLPTADSVAVRRHPIATVAETQPVPDVKTRHAIAAYSGLLLTLILLDTAVACLLVYRVIRYLRPKRPAVRIKTTVIDAWAEAGKRLEEPDEP